MLVVSKLSGRVWEAERQRVGGFQDGDGDNVITTITPLLGTEGCVFFHLHKLASVSGRDVATGRLLLILTSKIQTLWAKA